MDEKEVTKQIDKAFDPGDYSDGMSDDDLSHVGEKERRLSHRIPAWKNRLSMPTSPKKNSHPMDANSLD